ncbi:MAG: hypothetical protein IT353_00540 [Gemmatimonadaceae bacterium]|nr:hypothetical protein [Gemmatimonadaceae bacterium]
MLIETRVLGKKARPMDQWAVTDLPPLDPRDGGDSTTLRALIARIVRHEVAAFGRREQARRLVRVLSASEIEEAQLRGKIDPGGRPMSAPVDPEQAVATALQGFEDGLYLVMIDGVEQRDLNASVFVTDASQLVFIRLTFLAGA